MKHPSTPHPHRCPGCQHDWFCRNEECQDPFLIWCKRHLVCHIKEGTDWHRMEVLAQIGHNLDEESYVLRSIGHEDLYNMLRPVIDELRLIVDEASAELT